MDVQRTGRIFGWLFIGTFVTSIPARLLFIHGLNLGRVLAARSRPAPNPLALPLCAHLKYLGVWRVLSA